MTTKNKTNELWTVVTMTRTVRQLRRKVVLARLRPRLLPNPPRQLLRLPWMPLNVVNAPERSHHLEQTRMYPLNTNNREGKIHPRPHHHLSNPMYSLFIR